jgi:hypothetical protein
MIGGIIAEHRRPALDSGQCSEKMKGLGRGSPLFAGSGRSRIYGRFRSPPSAKHDVGLIKRECKGTVLVVDADAIAERADARSVITEREVEQAWDVDVNRLHRPGCCVDLIGGQCADFGL